MDLFDGMILDWGMTCVTHNVLSLLRLPTNFYFDLILGKFSS